MGDGEWGIGFFFFWNGFRVKDGGYILYLPNTG